MNDKPQWWLEAEYRVLEAGTPRPGETVTHVTCRMSRAAPPCVLLQMSKDAETPEEREKGIRKRGGPAWMLFIAYEAARHYENAKNFKNRMN